MGKFIIQPHSRLQEWVAEERGYFAAAGLDYEFRMSGEGARNPSVTSTDQSAPM